MRTRLIVTLLFAFSLISVAQSQRVAATPAGDGSAPNPFEGAKIFQYHCAACHGADGRGHGPAAAALKHAVPDLTAISQRSTGKFPYHRIRDFIGGMGSQPLAHGDREMPIWGPIFHQVEADQDWGEVRLDAITRHLESIQRK